MTKYKIIVARHGQDRRDKIYIIDAKLVSFSGRLLIFKNDNDEIMFITPSELTTVELSDDL